MLRVFLWPGRAPLKKIYSQFDMVTVDEAVHDIFSDHDAIRFFKFALSFPALLNKAEEEMFNKIINTNYFWMHYSVVVENEWGQFLEHEWMRTSIFEGLVQENLFEYWEKIKLQEITLHELLELPRGKDLHAPLRSDPHAIAKIIEKSDEQDPYDIVFAWREESQFELSPSETFWKKHSKKLVTQKVEVKVTDEGHQIITTLSVSDDFEEKKAWFDFCQKKKEEKNNDN
jgi:hypothetical protein